MGIDACCATREEAGNSIVATGGIAITRAKDRQSIAMIRKRQTDLKETHRKVIETIERGQPWTDWDFPPELGSLYQPKVDKVNKRVYDKL